MKKLIKSIFVEGSEEMLNAFENNGVNFKVDPKQLEENFPQTLNKNAGKLYPDAENLIVNKAPVTITKHNPSADVIATAIAGGDTIADIHIKPHSQGKGVNVHINRRKGTPTHDLTKDSEVKADKKNSFQIGGTCTRWTFLPK